MNKNRQNTMLWYTFKNGEEREREREREKKKKKKKTNN
jgi:hypothetical protein